MWEIALGVGIFFLEWEIIIGVGRISLEWDICYRSGETWVVSQRGPTRRLNPAPRPLSHMRLPLDHFPEFPGVGHLSPLTTPRGLGEHQLRGLPAWLCSLGDARPPHISATTLTTEPPDYFFKN